MFKLFILIVASSTIATEDLTNQLIHPAKVLKPRQGSIPTTSACEWLPISTNNRCGVEFGTRCPDGKCCSNIGYCDVGEAWCGAGCQRAFGVCYDYTGMIGLNCGGSINSTGTGKCPTYPVASQYLRCGEAFGFACPDRMCCSAQGICKADTDVTACDAGCQRGWGYCFGKGSFVCFKQTDAATTTRACPAYPETKNGRCGPDFGNTRCPIGICCSTGQYCEDSGGNNGSAWCSPETCLRGYGKCNGFGSYTCPIAPLPSSSSSIISLGFISLVMYTLIVNL